MFKKQRPARNKKYREFVSRQSCCLTGFVSTDYEKVDAHHQNKQGHGSTGSKCCDSRCVPVRHSIHAVIKRSTWAEYGVDPEKVVERMRAAWVAQGGNIFWVD